MQLLVISLVSLLINSELKPDPMASLNLVDSVELPVYVQDVLALSRHVPSEKAEDVMWPDFTFEKVTGILETTNLYFGGYHVIFGVENHFDDKVYLKLFLKRDYAVIRRIEDIFGPAESSSSVSFSLGGTEYDSPFANSSWRGAGGFEIYVKASSKFQDQDGEPVDKGLMCIAISNMKDWEKMRDRIKAKMVFELPDTLSEEEHARRLDEILGKE